MKNKVLKITAGALGVVMIATAAFAGAASSGYEGVKASAKKTAAFLTQDARSFTVNSCLAIDIDGSNIHKNDSTQKVDVSRGAYEQTETRYEDGNAVMEYYRYGDSEMSVRKSTDGKYHVVNYGEGHNALKYILENPFEKQVVQDLEKVADVLGSQYDYLLQREKNDASELFFVELKNGNTPVLVNAVMSFVAKQVGVGFGADMRKDVFVESIDGVYEVDADGLFKNAEGKISFSYKDRDDVSHKIDFNLKISLYGVNSTEVAKIDLSGKEIESVSESAPGGGDMYTFTPHYVGDYKGDIVERSEDGFKKTGEVHLRIDSIGENGAVSGNVSAPFILNESLDFFVDFESDESSNIVYVDNNGVEKFATIDVGYSNSGSVEVIFGFSEADSVNRTERYILNRVF